MQTDWRVSHRDGAQLAHHLREQSLGSLATLQHGVVSHSQLLELGFSRREIGVRSRAGRLRPVHRGVYAVGHDALGRSGRWKAATLAGGDDALLSHRSAAALWGLAPPAGGRIEVSVTGARGRSFPDLRIHRRTRLLDVDRAERQGIPCTSVARTLLDLAAVARAKQVLEACEQALALRLFDLAPLAEVLDRCRGQRGTRVLAEALCHLTDEPDLLRGELEGRLRWLVLSSPLPRGRHNFHVRGASGTLWECDVVWPAARLVVEADSRAYHSSRAARERDARKQADLEGAGWHVERLRWADVTAHPAPTLATLRRRLARCAP